MKPVKFAYILMGKGFSEKMNSAYISNEYNDASIFGVDNLDEACHLAKDLKDRGYECIELCGAFLESGANAVIEATGNAVAVGYSVHFHSQDELFDKLFS